LSPKQAFPTTAFYKEIRTAWNGESAAAWKTSLSSEIIGGAIILILCFGRGEPRSARPLQLRTRSDPQFKYSSLAFHFCTRALIGVLAGRSSPALSSLLSGVFRNKLTPYPSHGLRLLI
jgi:hypothetical protein